MRGHLLAVVLSRTDDPATAFRCTMAVGDWQVNKSVQQYTDPNGKFVGSWAKDGDRAFALHAAVAITRNQSGYAAGSASRPRSGRPWFSKPLSQA
jgi:hypothetical protein